MQVYRVYRYIQRDGWGWMGGYRDEYKEGIEGGIEYKDDDKIENSL